MYAGNLKKFVFVLALTSHLISTEILILKLFR